MIHAEGVGERDGYSIGLYRRQEHTARHYSANGEHHAKPSGVQPFLDVIRWTATVFSFMVFFIYLGQRSLGKCRTGAEKGDDPHPHDGTGTTIAYGGGHPNDVACTHTTREGHGKGLKRGDSSLLLFVGRKKQTRHLTETAHLYETRTKREVESRRQTKHHEGGTPHPSIYGIDNPLNHWAYSSPLKVWVRLISLHCKVTEEHSCIL